MLKKRLPIVLGILAASTLGLLFRPASASTATGTLTVTTTVASSCSVNSPTLTFSGYTGAAAVTSNATLSVTCTNTTPYTIGLGNGQNYNASGGNLRNMSVTVGGTTYYLPYDLYQSGSTTNWGNTAGTNTVAGTGTGTAQSYTVAGNLPASSNPTPGTYKDTVAITVTY